MNLFLPFFNKPYFQKDICYHYNAKPCIAQCESSRTMWRVCHQSPATCLGQSRCKADPGASSSYAQKNSERKLSNVWLIAEYTTRHSAVCSALQLLSWASGSRGAALYTHGPPPQLSQLRPELHASQRPPTFQPQVHPSVNTWRLFLICCLDRLASFFLSFHLGPQKLMSI